MGRPEIGEEVHVVNGGSAFTGAVGTVTGHGRALIFVEVTNPPSLYPNIKGREIFCMESELLRKGDQWSAGTKERRTT